MPGNVDATQPPTLVSGPLMMPPEEVQALIADRAYHQAVERIKGQIRAWCGLAAVGLAAAGWLGFNKLDSLEKQVTAVHERASEADQLAADLKQRLDQADRLQAGIRDAGLQQSVSYAQLINTYSRGAEQATVAANQAYQQAREASLNATEASEQVKLHSRFIELMQSRITAAVDSTRDRNQQFRQMYSEVSDRVLAVWTVVVDEGRHSEPIGDTGLEAMVRSVRAGREVRLQILDRSRGLAVVCGEGGGMVLEINNAVDCPYGSFIYRVTLTWAMKQGGFLPWYRDRAALTVRRISAPATAATVAARP